MRLQIPKNRGAKIILIFMISIAFLMRIIHETHYQQNIIKITVESLHASEERLPVSTKTTTNRSNHLFSVPFYIYENEILRNKTIYNFTEICSWHRVDNPALVCDDINSFEDMVDHKIFVKYVESSDVAFIQSALVHPMRTKDPNQAKIFVVPTFLSRVISDFIYHKDQYNQYGQKLVKSLDDALGSMTWFRKANGKDHVAIVTALQAQKVLKRHMKHVSSCNMIQWYEGEGPSAVYINNKWINERVFFPTMYVGKVQCNITSIKKHDVVFIGALHRSKGRCPQCNHRMRFRRFGHEWFSKQTNWTADIFGYSEGKNTTCPYLAEAHIGMHFHGDTPSASRLSETILSGTVPIFTTKIQYEAVPDWIDWEKISYFADVEETNMTLFDSQMNAILNNKTDIAMKTKAVIENKDLFDWQTDVPFELYMYKLQTILYPSHGHVVNSPYSALKL